MAMPSIMNHRFSQIPQNPLERSSFDRSHGYKTTFDAGYLIPVCLEEILPGDTVAMDATFFARVATLLYPIMDNIFLDTFWFFCPNRLVWDNWQKFNGERLNPNTSIDVEIPYITAEGGYEFAAFSLHDYFGLPVGQFFDSTYTRISALPSRMYNLIWNEWFRDQNIQNSVVVPTGDGPDAYAGSFNNSILLRRGKRHDIFTSCLPWPQKGDAVALPLGTSAPVIGNGQTISLQDGITGYGIAYSNDAGFNGFMRVYDGSDGTAAGSAVAGNPPAGDLTLGLTSNPANSGMIADLSNATSATINQLREAFAIQQLLELDARGGTRYVEQLRTLWGVQVPDFRLQRPEYLGGSSERIGITSVAQTSEGTVTDPLGRLGATGQLATRSGFNKSFVEHGYIMCLANVRADISYQECIDRHWTRATRYDFYQPPLAHLGEEAIYEREIQYDTTDQATQTVFGYQERWSHYRYSRSKVTGAFRSNFAQTLDAWHLGLEFATPPALDSSFIVDNPPIDRIRAIVPGEPDNQQIIMDCYFSFRHARLMPVYSVPGLQRL